MGHAFFSKRALDVDALILSMADTGGPRCFMFLSKILFKCHWKNVSLGRIFKLIFFCLNPMFKIVCMSYWDPEIILKFLKSLRLLKLYVFFEADVIHFLSKKSLLPIFVNN